MNTALDGSQTVITPASTVTDAPTVSPTAIKSMSRATTRRNTRRCDLRYALAMSLNNATVKLAEEVGYDKVASWRNRRESLR